MRGLLLAFAFALTVCCGHRLMARLEAWLQSVWAQASKAEKLNSKGENATTR